MSRFKIRLYSLLKVFSPGLVALMPVVVRCAPCIDITPNPATFGEPVKIVLHGFPPHQAVTVRVSTTNEFGQTWQSHATFRADLCGCVDVATRAPISGTYRRADALGLFRSMSLPDTNKVTANLAHDELKPVNLYFTASSSGNSPILATAKFQRLFLAPGVERIPVHDGKLRGTLFIPAGAGPHPAVITLGGSEGGLHEVEAAFLASKGYAALALAYFAYDDLPASLENIPLEYFQPAIAWLQSQPRISAGRIAVMGVSRGAELALLLGSKYPQIKAVIALAPSGVVWSGINDTNGTTQLPAWTCQGRPLPFMQFDNLSSRQQRQIKKIVHMPPISFTPVFQMMLENRAETARASIPVEKINGPILLISGSDDGVWPSAEMADAVMKRLKQARHPFADRHLNYKHVGHFIPIPGYPATIHTVLDPEIKMELSIGGDTEHTATASEDSWPQIMKFLDLAFLDANQR